MKHYVGLDVSMKKTSVCIVNKQGKIVHESADALRAGIYSRVHEKPQKAIDRSAVLSMRRFQVKQRTDIKNHVQGILKSYGIRLGSVGPARFSQVVKFCIEGCSILSFVR